MKRIFLPSAKFLQQIPTRKEVQEIVEAPVENVEEKEDVMEVVTNEIPQVKTTSKKKKRNK